MKFGISPLLSALTPNAMPIPILARAIQEAGFESVFVSEHTHVPLEMETAFPVEQRFRDIEQLAGGPGVIPREFAGFWDPIVLAATITGATDALKVGFSVLLVPQRDPIILAKEIASLDQLSGGRVLVGVGTGWLDEELRNHGGDPRTRTRVLHERVEAMKAIWTHDAAEYHGDHVDFDPIMQWPKPLQQPHPPILLGGHGPSVLARAIDLGAGWLAPGTRMDLDELAVRMRELDELVRASGAPRVPVTFTVHPDPAEIERAGELGVDRCLLRLEPGSADEVRRRLDEMALLIAPHL